MADEDDKIRRNLVVVSSGVLASSYLGIPFAAVWEKLIGTLSIAQPQPNELIACGLVVLMYLALRYRFSAEGERYVSDRQEALQEHHWLYVKQLVETHSRATLATGGSQRTKFTDLDDIRKVLLENIAGHHALTVVEFVKFNSFLIHKGESGWAGRVSFDISWRTSTRSSVGQLQERGTDFVVVGSFDRIRVLLRAWLTATLYSKAAVGLLFPILLGIGAVLALCWKVVLLLP